MSELLTKHCLHNPPTLSTISTRGWGAATSGTSDPLQHPVSAYASLFQPHRRMQFYGAGPLTRWGNTCY